MPIILSGNTDRNSLALRDAPAWIVAADYIDDEDGAVVFEQACRMGLAGIVSKRRGSRYRSGRTRDWIIP